MCLWAHNGISGINFVCVFQTLSELLKCASEYFKNQCVSFVCKNELDK